MPTAAVPEDWFELFDEMNPNWVWKTFQGHIENQTLNSLPIGLPFISEAAHFNLGCMIVKRPTPLLGTTYVSLGPVHRWLKDLTPEFRTQLDQAVQDPEAYDTEKYNYAVGGREDGLCKEISITCNGSGKFVLPDLMPENTVIDMSILPNWAKRRFKALYLIDRVWYCSDFTMDLRIGTEVQSYEWNYLPVGFTMVKYPVKSANGEIGLPSKLITNLKEFKGKWRFMDEVMTKREWDRFEAVRRSEELRKSQPNLAEFTDLSPEYLSFT